jgi:uncharacterized repeat protein (TIGR01451 family)
MRRLVVTLLVVLGLTALSGVAVAQSSFSPSTQAVSEPSGPQQGGGPCGPTTITHSTSQAITALNSVSCNNLNGHADNSYFRAFDLASFGIIGDFEVCAIEVGVETSTAPGGTQPVDINLSTSSPAFPGGVQTAIGDGNFTVAGGVALTIVSFPIVATAPAGSELVVEVFTPNGQAAGNFFFIGSNAGGQTGPSYLQAADCGINAPTPTGSIGFPNMHVVLNVIGTEALGNVEADLSVLKTASVNPDDTVEFDITVTNNGPDDAENVVVTDPLPPCTTYISDDCGGADVPPWTWNVGDLPVNTSAICTITVDGSGCEGEQINIASATSDQTDPNPGDESSTATFQLGGGVLEIPTLGRWGILALIGLLIGVGIWRMRSV